jgi:phosphate transport system substrate-binding protein
MIARRQLLTCAAAVAAPGAWAQAAPEGVARAASDLPPYTPTLKIGGAPNTPVKAAGSSTVAALLKQVVDGFAAVQPGLNIEIAGAGSSTALAGLLESPGTMGLLSRTMTPRERDAFRAKYGHAPTELKIAVDAVGIYVFKDNPVPSLSLSDLRRAFGRDPDAVDRWGALGLSQDAWRERPIVRFGLEQGRGAHELFREIVLEGSAFATDISNEPVSTSVVQGVATQAGGIGYASVFFRNLRTRLVPIKHQDEAVEPNAANALSGKYPLARFLYVIVNQKPGQPLEAAQRQFMQFLLSRDGQDLVARQGFFSLDAGTARQALAQIEGR